MFTATVAGFLGPIEKKSSSKGNEYITSYVKYSYRDRDEVKFGLVSIVAFGKFVEILSSFSQGEFVVVNGNLEIYLGKDREGSPAARSKMIVSNLFKLSPSQKEESVPEKADSSEDENDDDSPVLFS